MLLFYKCLEFINTVFLVLLIRVISFDDLHAPFFSVRREQHLVQSRITLLFIHKLDEFRHRYCLRLGAREYIQGDGSVSA
jgi:hypothetical protein